MIQWVYADERSLSILERSFFSLLHLVCRPYNRNILGRAFCVSSKLRKGYPSSKLTNYSAILCSFCSVLPSFSCFQMFQDQLGLLLLGIFQKIGFSLSPRKKNDFKKKIIYSDGKIFGCCVTKTIQKPSRLWIISLVWASVLQGCFSLEIIV